MPQVQRTGIPRALLAHLLLRIQERHISAAGLEALAAWLDTHPEVPTGDWFKRLPTLIVCGRGRLVRTFLSPTQAPTGKEI
ncbi:MAG: hypothetical protein FJ382_01195 [Verrucomicrobia bacterium]|nr:hypothetical protein [Verrucomicrobiota bacterium]